MLTYEKFVLEHFIEKCKESITGIGCQVRAHNEAKFSFSFQKNEVHYYNYATSKTTHEKAIELFTCSLKMINNGTNTIAIHNMKKNDAMTIFCKRPNLDGGCNFIIDTETGELTYEYTEPEPVELVEPKTIVEWIDENKGIKKHYNSRGKCDMSSSCYSPAYAQQLAYLNGCVQLIKNNEYMYCLHNDLECDYGKLDSGINQMLRYAEPYTYTDIKQIKAKIVNAVKEYIKQNVDTRLSFVAKVSKNRDWKSACFICLEEGENMGKTCSCGHCETVMFQPCEHTMCLKPCFVQFMEMQGFIDKLKQKTMMIDGQSYYLNNSIDVDINVNFLCPYCKQTVEHTFCVETDVKMDDIDKEFFEKILPKNKFPSVSQ